MPRLALLCLVGLLAGCGRFSPGFIITDDGQVLANSPTNQRERVAEVIRSRLDEQLGGHWHPRVSIAELPEYLDDERGPGSDWRWPQATVRVELVGDGGAEPTATTDQVRDAVRDYLAPKVVRPSNNLVIEVTRVVDAARFATLATPVAVSAPATTASAPRNYTVQANDTLAEISAAFYGAPTHWRQIVDANPGLDPAGLRVGQTIIIPPLK